MKYTIKLFLGVIMVLSWMAGLTQNLSNSGTDFWVGYGHHQFMEWSITNPTSPQANSQEMVIYLSAEQPAKVTVSIHGTTWVKNYSVPANSVITTDLIPKTAPIDARFFTVPTSYGGTGGEGLFTNKAIHIVSDVPIVAYAHIYGSASSGATMLMPVETWGYAYTSVNSKQQYAADCYSWMYVIAKEDNTVVEITPSVPTRFGKSANVPFTATLMKGEAYQIIGANKTSNTGYELTGTKVKSIANAEGKCYPIAVFAGSSRTTNPASCGSGGGDNDNQQLFPSQAWGKRYLTSPTSSSTNASTFMKNTFKIVVKDPTTVVKRNGVNLTPLPDGYYMYESNTADYIESDKPIMVGQFMTGGGCLNGGVGDPEMFFISPLEQGIKRIGFYRNTMEGITTNYLTLIIPKNGMNSLTIDGVANNYTHVFSHPQLMGYNVVIKRWSAAKAQCIVQSDSAFTAVTYGLGSVESYAFNAGTMINNLNILGSIHNELDPTVAEHPYTCTNTPVQLGVYVAYQPTRMVWRLGALGSAISPNNDVTVDNPVPVGTYLVNGVTYYRYQLPQTYNFPNSGDYEVPITSTNPGLERCDNSEDVKFIVQVREKPAAEFSFTHSGCVKDTVYLSGSAGSSNGYGIGKWQWTLPDGTTSDVQNPKLVLPATGANNVNLKVISTEGCVGETTQAITAYPTPTADFNFSPSPVCEGGSISFSDISSVAGGPPVNSWYWDMGVGAPVTVPNGDAQSATYPTYGTYTVRQVVKSSSTCISDTISKVITVYAKPNPSFSYPAGCMPVDGVVQFNTTSSTPDGQALASHAWNFGDPNANASNPNTSTLANPTHTYSYGTYDISYKVTTANGCLKDTLVRATFNVKPVLTYSTLAPVCESVTGSVSVATASVSNGVPGSGYYKGTATDSSGQLKPSVAGAGTHTIWYVFTSSGGCVDSVSQTILIHAKSKAEFTYPTGGCLPITGLAQFTNTTTISDGQSMTYTWDFGDPNANSSNPNISTLQHPTHNYSNYGTYTIKLTVTTQNGCVDDTAVTTPFSVKPALSYSALAPVCESVSGIVSEATATVTNGVTGTGVYRGPGTDNAGNFNPSAAGAGTHTLWYVFTSSGGCTDSVFQTITVYPKPSSGFTVESDICLDKTATFTDASTIASGSITGRTWNFSDGTTPVTNASNAPFNRAFAQDGSYQVKLTTTSDYGCVSDVATRTVTVHPLPVADFDLPAVVCMPNGAARFTNRSTLKGNDALTYAWNFGDGSSASSSSNPSHVYATAGSYPVQLTTTSAFGCVSDTTRVLRAFYDKPSALFEVAPDTLCQGAESIFTDKSTAPGSTMQGWQWNFGDGASSTTQNARNRYRAPGNYTVQLVVTNAVGCASDPYTQEVKVYLQPVIDAGPSFVVPQGTAIMFNPKVNDSATVSFEWTPGAGLSDATSLHPTMIAMADGAYTLTATGEGNCTATDEITVKILKPVKIPNAFSPNGDGINDRWEVINLEDYPGATVEVFNRYGQPVFYSNGYSQPWDGRLKGNHLPVATYYYVITLKNGFKPITGSVTIVR